MPAQLSTLPLGEQEGTCGQRRRLIRGFWQQAPEEERVVVVQGRLKIYSMPRFSGAVCAHAVATWWMILWNLRRVVLPVRLNISRMP